VYTVKVTVLGTQFDEFWQTCLVSQPPPQSKHRMFSSPQKVALCPFVISFLPLFSPWQPRVISVFIVLYFLECHINGIVQYVGFCDKFLLLSIRLLRFICVVAHISSLLVTAFWNWIRIPFNFGTTVKKDWTTLDILL